MSKKIFWTISMSIPSVGQFFLKKLGKLFYFGVGLQLKPQLSKILMSKRSSKEVWVSSILIMAEKNISKMAKHVNQVDMLWNTGAQKSSEEVTILEYHFANLKYCPHICMARLYRGRERKT